MKREKQKNFSKQDKFLTYNGEKAGKKGKGHPHYVYAESGHKYHSFGVTTSQFTEEDNGNITENILLNKNPNSKDLRLSYVRPVHISDRRINYKTDEKYNSWVLDEKDKKKHIPSKWKK